jgi:hypothetical protein
MADLQVCEVGTQLAALASSSSNGVEKCEDLIYENDQQDAIL